MKILVVDDHPLVRNGIRQLYASAGDVIVIEAHDVTTTLDMARVEKPDVYIIDMKLKGASGLEVLRRLKAYDRTAKVLIYTAHGDAADASRALRSGALGYITKGTTLDELKASVLCVMRNERYLEADMSAAVFLYCTTTEHGLNKLTNREQEIVRMLSDGMSLQEIALELGAAYKTIANISSRIKEKLDLRRTSDLIRLYLERQSH